MENSTKITTIKISRHTKERLEKLRSYKRESYDELLEKLLEILNDFRASPMRAKAKLIALDKLHKKTDKTKA